MTIIFLLLSLSGFACLLWMAIRRNRRDRSRS